jgi:hypothetical protein
VPDRLSIMNDALVNTGNNRIQVEFEDTQEWDVAKTAYDRFLPQLLEAHPWNFATATEALTQLADTENPSQQYSADLGGYAYSMPGLCLWLEAVWMNGNTINFEIVDDKICTFFNNDTYDLMAKFVRVPATDKPSNLFWEALRKLVESGCLRGLNEENSEATRREQEGWQMLRVAATRSDQQQPRRYPRRSRILARRRGFIVGQT